MMNGDDGDMEDVLGHFFGGGGAMGGGHPFADMFGGGHPFGGGGSHMRGPRRGKDVLHPLKVTLEELYKGKTSKIQLNKTVICNKCKGQGSNKHGASSTCGECKGRGMVIKMRQLAPGMVQQMRLECPTCNGEGTNIAEKDKCKSCGGHKVVKEIKILEVPIKKGSLNEQKIRFSGEGDQTPGIEPGDVIIVIVEQPHDHFTRKGDHLIYSMQITLNQALTGFEKVIKHLDGRDVVLTSPMGQVVEPGALYKVQEEGMPKNRDPTTKGDLYVTCEIQFPDKIDDPAKLERFLPARPVYKFDENDENTEEVDMMEYTEDLGASGSNHHGGRGATESDSDDEQGGPHVQQCATG